MYPDKATCEKRLHMINIQLEGLLDSRTKVNVYITKLEREKALLYDIMNLGANNAGNNTSSQ
jgi:hypothetical protein